MEKHSGIKDGGEYFVISPTSRKVTVPHSQKSIGTVGDHCSEQVTFMCPQMVDGHDVSRCSHRYVTWFNVNGEIGHDELKLAQVKRPEEGMIYLAWTIRNALTVAKGIVKFSVHFEDQDNNGITLYRWSTATCKDCDILDSINGLLGTYKSMHVSGEKLVIEDYTLVNKNTLFLDSKIIPEGRVQITENGTFDVYKYAQAEVSVDKPAGTLNITENGMYDVDKFANVNVNVPSPQDYVKTSPISLVNKDEKDADVYCTVKKGQEIQYVKAILKSGSSLPVLDIVTGTLLFVSFPTIEVVHSFEMGNVEYLYCGSGDYVFRVGLGEETITFE